MQGVVRGRCLHIYILHVNWRKCEESGVVVTNAENDLYYFHDP